MTQQEIDKLKTQQQPDIIEHKLIDTHEMLLTEKLSLELKLGIRRPVIGSKCIEIIFEDKKKARLIDNQENPKIPMSFDSTLQDQKERLKLLNTKLQEIHETFRQLKKEHIQNLPEAEKNNFSLDHLNLEGFVIQKCDFI